MKNYVSMGATIEWTNPGSAVVAGAVVVVGHLLGIAVVDIANGETGTVQIAGVFEVPCNAADTITQGMKLDWDASASEFVDNIGSPAAGDHTDGVVAVADKIGATVLVKLCPGQGTTS